MRWGLEHQPTSVLEPACGDGVFLTALAAHSGTVQAVELLPEEAGKASRILGGRGQVTCGDYLEIARTQLAGRRFDLVVGNPPYIRYQYLSSAQVAAAQALLAHHDLPLARHLSSWAPFVVDGAARLTDKGRLAMVVPAELLQVKYTAALREWLAGLGRLLVLRFRKLVFPKVQQEVVLLLLDRAAPAGIRVLELEDSAQLAGFDPDAVSCAPPQDLPLGAKWTGYALDPRDLALLGRLDDHPGLARFDDLAEVRVGVVTGANRFFCADEATVQAHQLQDIALPMFGRSAGVRGLRFTAADHAHNRTAGRRCWLLRFPERPLRDLAPPWQAYLRRGEDQGLPARYKCRIRQPWYAVPSIWAAPMALFKRCHESTRLVLNTARAHSTDTAYRVVPRPGVQAADLAWGFVNSLTMLSVELCGRSYGGGVLELIPSEIRQLRIPRVSCPAGEIGALDRSLRNGAPIEVLLDRGDALILRDQLALEHDTIQRLRACWRQLVQRRIGRRG